LLFAVPTPAQSLKPVAVIGGGATALAAAYKLTQLGRRVRLFEASSRLGGAVHSERSDGWLVEAGPNTIVENHREILSLVTELGLDHERVITSRTAKNRYIVRDGKPHVVPTSALGLWRTTLLSGRSKRRLFTELWAKPQERASDISLAEFVAAHFGQEIVDYVINPLVSGIYAGDPAQLSTRHTFPQLLRSEQSHGSLIRGQIAQIKTGRARGEPKSRIMSFREGLQTLTNALAQRLPDGSTELNAGVVNLRTALGAPWSVTWTRDGVAHTEEFGAVVLALPANALARLTFGLDAQRPLAVLDEVVHPSVASLFLGFRREQVRHPLDGFGVLVPAAEKRNLLGVLFSSSLFPGRAPDGHVALTAMVGGSSNPKTAALPPDELRATVLTELRELLGVTGEPVFYRLNRWSHAIPQYNLGYDRFLDTIATCEQMYGGLFIGGQARNGVALPSCLRAGLTLGEKAAR
jgi:oxygen-dependent protoporphyrinogen oxidase